MKRYISLAVLVLPLLAGIAFAQTTPTTTPTPTTEQLQQTIIELQKQLLAKQHTASVEQAKPVALTPDEINKGKAEKITKARLKDPDSYQNISWTVCEGVSYAEPICNLVAKEKYVRFGGIKRAKTSDDIICVLRYRAKNSLGGYSGKVGMNMFWVSKMAPFVFPYEPVNFAIVTQVASYMSNNGMD